VVVVVVVGVAAAGAVVVVVVGASVVLVLVLLLVLVLVVVGAAVVVVVLVLVEVVVVARSADMVRSKRESVSLIDRCASRTATTLVPFRNSDGAIVKLRTVSSPEPASRARTGYIVVVDMLSRTASTPLTKTIAPSSATRFTLTS
jgi:hypothetical protein